MKSTSIIRMGARCATTFRPQLGADLCRGFEHFRQLDDTNDEHIDSLLKRLMLLEQESGKKLDADVVTWRGMMSKIMATPGR